MFLQREEIPMKQIHKIKTRNVIAILLGVAVVAVIAAVLIPGYIQKKDMEKNSEILHDIWSEYQAGEYENVLSLAEAAPKPYDSYYKKYMSYRTELDSWRGTERELYEWFSAFMEQMDIETIPENTYSTEERLLSKLGLASYKKLLAKKKDWIESTLVWYPEFYQIRVEFYEKYFMLLIENRNLFGAAPEAGIVTIPVNNMSALDSQMDELVHESVQALRELQEKYDIVGDEEHNTIYKEKIAIQDFKKHYYDSAAVSTLYDLDGKEYVYIAADTAENNYDVFTKLIRLQLLSVGDIVKSAEAGFNAALNEELYDIPYECVYYEGPIAEVLPMIYRIFPKSTLSLAEPEFALTSRVIGDFVDAHMED